MPKKTMAKPPASRTRAPRKRTAVARPPLTVTRPELLVNGSDHDFRRLVQALLPFLAIHTAVRDRYASLLGLSGPQYTIMMCIRRLADAGPVNVRTVANSLWLSPSFVTAETNALERSQYVLKTRGSLDKRTVSLSLTAEGAALLDSIAPLRQRVNDVQFGALDAAEFRLLVPVIERLVQSGERALALFEYLQSHAGVDEANAASVREAALMR
jgi:MarR family transcriptional regulator, organic hydroperoxide resistance regulator